MIKLTQGKVYYSNGKLLSENEVRALGVNMCDLNKKTMAYSILSAHNENNDDKKLIIIK